MIERIDMVDERSPAGLRVVQLTDGPFQCSHIYMEAQIFTPDSMHMILHQGSDAHGQADRNANHLFMRCDLDDDCSLHPMTDEPGVTGPSVSPDGRYLYYFVDETRINGGRLTLKRVNIDGTERHTIHMLDAPLPEFGVQPSRIYPLSTISSDGRRIAIGCFLGDGETDDAPFGVLVFDVNTGELHVPVLGPTFCNPHPQYCRSTDPQHAHDLLIQENHGNTHDRDGRFQVLVSGRGADIHIVRDDGSNWRTLPWGRDDAEHCQGHQCWRGQSTWAITSTEDPGAQNLIESQARSSLDHEGRCIGADSDASSDGGVRNVLSREHDAPHYYHFATDRAGDRLITDYFIRGRSPELYVAELGEVGRDPLKQTRYLLDTRSSNRKQAHVHPFLSPDGTVGFFNSDETGTLHAYMVTGWM